MEFYPIVFILCGIIYFCIKFYQAYFSSFILICYLVYNIGVEIIQAEWNIKESAGILEQLLEY